MPVSAYARYDKRFCPGDIVAPAHGIWLTVRPGGLTETNFSIALIPPGTTCFVVATFDDEVMVMVNDVIGWYLIVAFMVVVR